jgi:hypothetical protein
VFATCLPPGRLTTAPFSLRSGPVSASYYLYIAIRCFPTFVSLKKAFKVSLNGL